MTPRGIAGVLVVAIVVADAAVALAGEDDAEIEKELKRIATHVESERWEAGHRAIVDLLTEHPGDRRLLQELPSLEESLQTCLFNEQFELPHPSVVFGRSARSLDPRKRVLVIASASADEEHGWIDGGDGIRTYPVVFEDVEVTCRSRDGAGVLLSWSDAERGGYQLVSGYYKPSTTSYKTLDRMILRRDDGASEELHRKPCATEWTASTDFEFRRKGASLELRIDGKRQAKATDRRYEKGVVGVFEILQRSSEFDAQVLPVRDIKIVGTVAEEDYERTMASYRTNAFTIWRNTQYDREKELPRWVFDPDVVSAGAAGPVELPSDASDDAGRVEGMVADFLAGRHDDLVAKAADLSSLRSRTRRYVEGLVALAKGESSEAFTAFEWLAENEPHFGTGLAYYAQCLLQGFRIAEARDAVARATEESPDAPAVLETRALLALWEGDPEEAKAVLRAAAERGVDTEGIAAIREFVRRREEGPRWARSHAHRTKHFDISSDLSEDICKDVGKLLEASLMAYSSDFARLLDRDRARVFVFSGRAGYLEYARGIGSDLEGSAGAYMPALAQLVVWVPEDRERLWRTVKHEGFHQFLDNFLDDAPRWFDEGHAEYYETAGYEGGFLRTHAVNEEHVRLLRSRRMRPVSELMRMRAGEFMADAELHYAQSWALVHFLRKPPDRRYSGLLDAYFALLRDGVARSNAFEEVFGECADDLDDALEEYVKTLGE